MQHRFMTGIKKHIVLTLALYLAFVLILILGELIPSTAYYDNAIEAAKTIVDEGEYPSFLSVVMYDNWTDAFLINSLLTSSEENVFPNAIHNNVTIVSGKSVNDDTLPILKQMADSDSHINGEIAAYSRYWVGFKTVLKILLIFFSLKEIRTLLFLSCVFLFLIVEVKIYYEMGRRGLLAFTISVLSYMYLLNTPCMAFFFDVLIMLSFVYNILEKRKSAFSYYLVGAIVAFPCYWSFPLITLTYPLLIENLVPRGKRMPISELIFKSVAWMGGLVSTVAVKQLILFIMDGHETADGFGQMALRLGLDLGVSFRVFTPLIFIMDEFCYLGLVVAWIFVVLVLVFGTNLKLSYESKILLGGLSAIMIAMNIFGDNKIRAVLFVALFMAISVALIKHRNNYGNRYLNVYLISLYPLVWYYVFLEHSWHWFVHYIYGPTIFAILYVIFSSEELKIKKIC